MMLALSTESLKGYGLDRIFRYAKEAGFDGIDLAMDASDYDTMDAKYIKELIRENEIPVVSVQAPKKTSRNSIEDAIRLAKEIETKIIILQPPKLFDMKTAKWLKGTIPKIRQKENISIALENGPSTTLLGFIPEHAMNSLSDLKSFKHVALDTSRVHEKKEDLIKVYSILKKYLVAVHVSNVYHGKTYSPPESGVLPIESFLSKLKQDSFKGIVSIRVKPKYFYVGDDEKMVKSVKDSLEYCQKYLK
jgi:sugar phosphate isomerase/epimerase